MAAFYGVQPSPVDDSIWGQAMDVGFSRVDQPGYILRLVPGPDPANTALTEVYLPPDGVWGSRGIDSTRNGVVWTPFASGHIGSFDRRKCKGPLNGPASATGKHCPEGWTLYRMPGPQFKGVDEKGSANHAYYSGSIASTRSASATMCRSRRPMAAKSLLAVVDGKMVDSACPIRSASSPRTSMAASTIRMPAGKARSVDHVGDAHRVPQ